MKTIYWIIAILALSLWVCINKLQQTKSELVIAQTELKASKDIWWKFWTIANNWHDGITVSIPECGSHLDRSFCPIAVKIDGFPNARYEFSADGNKARFFLEDKETAWSLKGANKGN